MPTMALPLKKRMARNRKTLHSGTDYAQKALSQFKNRES
jgi:hypothetical protein